VWPVKVDFLTTFFMLFDAILTVIFEKKVFNTLKIVQGAFLGSFLFRKGFLER
jgi:hypothetical protein